MFFHSNYAVVLFCSFFCQHADCLTIKVQFLKMHLKTLTSHIVLLTVKNILCDSCELRSLSSLYFVLSTLRVFSISLHIILCFVTVKNCMHFVNSARSKTLRVFHSTAMSRIFNSKKTTPRCVNSVHSVHCLLFCGMRLKTLHIF